MNSTQMPSGGKLGNVEFDFKLIINSEMTKLSLALGNYKNDLEKYYKNIKLLLAGVIGWEHIPLYDILPVLFFSKTYNFTSNDDVDVYLVCPYCNKRVEHKLNLNNDIDYPAISDNLIKLKGLRLGGKEIYRINPTIKDFLETIETLLPFAESFSIDDLMFLTYFNFKLKPNEIMNSLKNAVKGEILVIHDIQSKLYCKPQANKKVKCQNCGEEVVIGNLTDVLITNPFHELRKYCTINKDLYIY